MDPGNSNQQEQQQEQQEQLQLEAQKKELVEELVQKRYRLNELMAKAAQRRASNAQLKIRLLAIQDELARAEETKNEIAKMCNSVPEWVQQMQEKLEKSVNGIQSGKEYAKTFNVIDEQEIRRLESELSQLPTEDELRQYATKKREQQHELDDLNKKIKAMETELDNNDDDGDEDDDDDDEDEILVQKIREAQQPNTELMNSPEQSQPVAEPSTKPDPGMVKSDKEKQDFLNNYFGGASSKMETFSVDVTSTKADPDGELSDHTKRYYVFSDDSS